MDLVKKIESLGSASGKLSKEVKITASGNPLSYHIHV